MITSLLVWTCLKFTVLHNWNHICYCRCLPHIYFNWCNLPRCVWWLTFRVFLMNFFVILSLGKTNPTFEQFTWTNLTVLFGVQLVLTSHLSPSFLVFIPTNKLTVEAVIVAALDINIQAKRLWSSTSQTAAHVTCEDIMRCHSASAAIAAATAVAT